MNIRTGSISPRGSGVYSNTIANRRELLPEAKACLDSCIPPLGRVARSARSWSVLGLLLAFGAVDGASQSIALETIILNTGWDQANSVQMGVGERDNEWRIPGGSPGQPSFVVSNSAWDLCVAPAPYLNSRWISTSAASGSPLPSPPTDFEYRFYFTLPAESVGETLNMRLNADDEIFEVSLNANPIPFTGSSFCGPDVSVSTGNSTYFKRGKDVNELLVVVRDTQQVISGLIVEGSVTYEDCDRPVLRNLPKLQSITFLEGTGAITAKGPYLPASLTLTTQRATLGSGAGTSNDFEGVPLTELYDVFYSTWNGSVDPFGKFVTIEALYSVSTGGGGLNIAAVRLDFPSGPRFANSVMSFVALGNNAIPLDVGKAVDNNVTTATSMGSTSTPPPTPPRRLRITLGFPCPCDDLVVDLSTGVTNVTGGLIAPGTTDDTWRLKCDPNLFFNPPLPPTWVITPLISSNWLTIPNSQWISFNSAGSGSSPVGDYCYTICFCLDKGFQSVSLSGLLRADNDAQVFVNGNLIATTPPTTSFSSPTPTPFSTTNTAFFHDGPDNCIDVVVHNDGGPTGLNLTGQLTAVAGRCCSPTRNVPTVSEWGLLVLLLGGMSMGTVLFGRRRRIPA